MCTYFYRSWTTWPKMAVKRFAIPRPLVYLAFQTISSDLAYGISRSKQDAIWITGLDLLTIIGTIHFDALLKGMAHVFPFLWWQIFIFQRRFQVCNFMRFWMLKHFISSWHNSPLQFFWTVQVKVTTYQITILYFPSGQTSSAIISYSLKWLIPFSQYTIVIRQTWLDFAIPAISINRFSLCPHFIVL